MYEKACCNQTRVYIIKCITKAKRAHCTSLKLMLHKVECALTIPGMKGDVIQMNKKAQSNHVAVKQKNFVLQL